MDQGIDIDAGDVNEYNDYMLYELSKHMDVKDIARKFHNASPEEIQNRIWNYVEKNASYNATKEIAKNG